MAPAAGLQRNPIIDALSKAAVTDDAWGYALTPTEVPASVLQARAEQRLQVISGASADAAEARGRMPAPQSSHLSSSAGVAAASDPKTGRLCVLPCWCLSVLTHRQSITLCCLHTVKIQRCIQQH